MQAVDVRPRWQELQLRVLAVVAPAADAGERQLRLGRGRVGVLAAFSV
jgi:hypothetical protein